MDILEKAVRGIYKNLCTIVQLPFKSKVSLGNFKIYLIVWDSNIFINNGQNCG